MNVQPIRSDQEYRDALKAVSVLFDNEPELGTHKGDWLEAMITLIESYEAMHFPLNRPSTIERTCSDSRRSST